MTSRRTFLAVIPAATLALAAARTSSAQAAKADVITKQGLMSGEREQRHR